MNIFGPPDGKSEDVGGAVMWGVIYGVKIGYYIGLGLCFLMILTFKALAFIVRLLWELWNRRSGGGGAAPVGANFCSTARN